MRNHYMGPHEWLVGRRPGEVVLTGDESRKMEGNYVTVQTRSNKFKWRIGVVDKIWHQQMLKPFFGPKFKQKKSSKFSRKIFSRGIAVYVMCICLKTLNENSFLGLDFKKNREHGVTRYTSSVVEWTPDKSALPKRTYNDEWTLS